MVITIYIFFFFGPYYRHIDCVNFSGISGILNYLSRIRSMVHTRNNFLTNSNTDILLAALVTSARGNEVKNYFIHIYNFYYIRPIDIAI